MPGQEPKAGVAELDRQTPGASAEYRPGAKAARIFFAFFALGLAAGLGWYASGPSQSY